MKKCMLAAAFVVGSLVGILTGTAITSTLAGQDLDVTFFL